MSKAFLRESDFGDVPDLPPPVSPLPPGARNYVTERGAELLRRHLTRLTDERPSLAEESTTDPEAKRSLQSLDQRIRYLRESLRTAEIVSPQVDDETAVRFGATVTVREPSGEVTRYRLVGVDEADPSHGAVSWTSPIARALNNGRRGERIHFQTPGGMTELEILDITYDRDPPPPST